MSNYKDLKHKNLVDKGTEGTSVATGTTVQRGSTTGQFRYNSTTGQFEGRNAGGFVPIEATPTVSSIDDTEVDSAGGGNQTIVITGTNFTSGDVASFIGSSANFNAATTTIDSPTQITAVAPKASFLNAQEPYGVRVTSTGGKEGTLASQINVDNAPTWTTASGNIGTVYDNATGNHMTVVASDAEGDTVAYTETGGTVLSGQNLTLNSSTGIISGDPTDVVSPTTHSFDLRATANSKTADRAFNIIVRHSAATGGNLLASYTYGGVTYRIHKFTSTGNFIVSATTTVDYLIIGGGGGGGHYSGGGGGAGGLVWQTGISLSAATYSAVIGTGGATHAGTGQGTNGVNSSFNSHIGLGGGAGGYHGAGGTNGGSGGGAGRGHAAGTTTQNSTYSYGIGFTSTDTGETEGSPNYTGYAGAGAGATNVGRIGGIGNSTFLTDAATTTAFLLGGVAGTDSSNVATTTSSTGTLYIAAGGGGTNQAALDASYAGGNGGGGQGNADFNSNTAPNYPTGGMVNTGSGSGGQAINTTGQSTTGGSGIVIIRYQ